MDNAMTRRELILRQLQNNGAMMLTNCASDPSITALILRYCHRSQAKSGTQIMTPHDLPAEADSPMDHLQAHDDRVHTLHSQALRTDDHLACNVLEAQSDCQGHLHEAQPGTTSSGRPCGPRSCNNEVVTDAVPAPW